MNRIVQSICHTINLNIEHLQQGSSSVLVSWPGGLEGSLCRFSDDEPDWKDWNRSIRYTVLQLDIREVVVMPVMSLKLLMYARCRLPLLVNKRNDVRHGPERQGLG